ncbi:MAG: DUF2149 domain-containing protein [Oscillospiraceae bacterium]|nr:DUF2149 domain-containing protein [Oscillospiraceae bacterium]
MHRSLRGQSLRNGKKHGGINPMDGLANLADAMLVLACGLMLALIINWNVDISLEEVDLSQGQEVTDVENLSEDLQAQMNDSDYQRMGTLYVDPETGKMVLLTEEAE